MSKGQASARVLLGMLRTSKIKQNKPVPLLTLSRSTRVSAPLMAILHLFSNLQITSFPFVQTWLHVSGCSAFLGTHLQSSETDLETQLLLHLCNSKCIFVMSMCTMLTQRSTLSTFSVLHQMCHLLKLALPLSLRCRFRPWFLQVLPPAPSAIISSTLLQ